MGDNALDTARELVGQIELEAQQIELEREHNRELLSNAEATITAMRERIRELEDGSQPQPIKLPTPQNLRLTAIDVRSFVIEWDPILIGVPAFVSLRLWTKAREWQVDVAATDGDGQLVTRYEWIESEDRPQWEFWASAQLVSDAPDVIDSDVTPPARVQLPAAPSKPSEPSPFPPPNGQEIRAYKPSEIPAAAAEAKAKGKTLVIAELDLRGTAMIWLERQSNFRIEGNRFGDLPGSGWMKQHAIFLHLGCRDFRIRGNRFDAGTGDCAIGGGYGDMSHGLILDNEVYDATEFVHLVNFTGSGMHISDNFGEGTRRMFIELQGGSRTTGDGGQGVRVVHNRARRWRNRYHESFGLSIVHWGDDTVVRANHLASGEFGEVDPAAHQAPVGIECMGRDMLVEGNQVDGFREGLHIGYGPRMTIRKNLLQWQTWMGIWRTGVNEAPACLVEDNLLVLPKVTAFLWQGGAGQNAGTIIRNNRLVLSKTAKEIDGDLAGVTVQGNKIERQS